METCTKIRAPKEGTEFLSQSHFSLGNDQRFITHSPHAYVSTSHKDYPPQESSRVEPAIIPQHASIMHKDKRVKVIETINKDHFGPVPLPQRQLEKMTLSKTNFKMDFDPRIDGFQTTNKLYHYPMHADMMPQKRNPLKSYIPQGDKEKAEEPKSDYKDKFLGKVLDEKVDSATDAFDGAPTIQGDFRSHLGHDMYDTTNNRELPYYSGHRKAIIPDDQHYPKTGIPAGKEWSLQSTHKSDFKFPSIGDQENIPTKNDILKTNYKLGDTRLNSFKTAIGDYVAAVKSARSPIAKVDMGKSSFPEGDGIPTAERAQTTLNREHFVGPPQGYSNPIVDGTNLHTASKVDFGRDPILYESTMKSGYARCPKDSAAGGSKDGGSKTMKSNFTIAQDGSHGMGMSSYKSAYKPTDGTERLVPNPVAIENLKKSYIRTPVGGLRELTTTQRDAFTRKEILDREYVDTGRLHRSNMPFAAKCR